MFHSKIRTCFFLDPTRRGLKGHNYKVLQDKSHRRGRGSADVKLIASRRQQHKLRSSIQQALSWSRKWDLPLNASKCHCPPDLRLVLPEEPDGKSTQKCEQESGTALHAGLSSAETFCHFDQPVPSRSLSTYIQSQYSQHELLFCFDDDIGMCGCALVYYIHNTCEQNKSTLQ